MVDLKISGGNLDNVSSPNVGKPTAGKAGEINFYDSVVTAQKSLVDGDLKEMLAQVRSLGDRFFKSPDENTLESYKSGIKSYLERVSKELFSLKQESGTPKEGYQKVYQFVETLDSETDSLTRETLQKDKSLRLLASLDEIRGLVLDLII